MSHSPPRSVLFGVSLICFANLLLEVVLTRIFSTTMFYHFTFVAVALALFGLGSAGVFVYVRADRFDAARAREDLARYARRFALATVLALAYVLANPIESITDAVGLVSSDTFTRRTFLQFVLLASVVALPFFYAGVVVALAVTHYRDAIERVYFYDLIGAGLAALAAGLLLGWLGGPTLVLVVAALAAGGALAFDGPGRRGAMALAAAVAVVGFNLWWPLFSVQSIKAVKTERVVFEKWNTFSRVTVEKQKTGHDIRIDAGARTRIASADEIPTREWRKDIAALVHTAFDGGHRVLIIGSGGGPDIVNALAAGAGGVVGVEVNPIIADDIMRGRFVEESRGLYLHPKVRIAVDDGRSFIRRSTERFDVIQATLVDTWAATAAGAFALSENTLYTVEAFEDYYRHLTDDGILTMTRWDVGAMPEAARLVVLAAGALERLGVPPGQTRRHMIFARDGFMGTLLVKRTPFTDAQIDRVEEVVAASPKWSLVLSPRTDGRHRYEKLVDAGAWSAVVAGQDFDLSPPTDDRPFFFYFVKGGDLFDLGAQLDADATANPALWILLTMGLCLIALTAGFIVLPLVRFRRRDLTAGLGARAAVGLGYFALIGLAFITVEIALLQKLALFLGHPSYALVVVLFAILVSTAGGARAARWSGWRGHAAVVGGVLVALLCVVYSLALGPLLTSWVAWPITARAPVAALLVALCGAPMGLLLPSGIAALARRDAHLVPWAWGVNGATSVIGTVAATVLAIHVGFATTLQVGGVLYALAAAVFVGLARLAASGTAGSGTPPAGEDTLPITAAGRRKVVAADGS